MNFFIIQSIVFSLTALSGNLAFGQTYASDSSLKYQVKEVKEVVKQKRDLKDIEPVLRPKRWWGQVKFAGALYDARNDVFAAIVSPAVSVGYRFKNWGFFGLVEYQRVSDFTLNIESLKLLNVGVGVEYLIFLGHVRSSFAAGSSILLTDTNIDEKGTNGWFFDLQPASLRWGIFDNMAIELSPLSFDVVAPVTSGIPLLLVSYMTSISLEWSF